MSLENLARVDLNLLVFLHVLLQERSVTKASEKLNLSQSAVSKSLARLRQLFDDKLFIRAPHGLVPTAQALLIKEALVPLLNNIDGLLAPKTFQPALSDRKFVMALTESVYALLLPSFINGVLSQAPGITLDALPFDKTALSKLQNRDIDFAITGKDIQEKDAALTMLTPKGVIHQELFRDNLCCLVRVDSPLLKRDWQLNTYMEAGHLQVKSGDDKWLLDYKLADKGLERDIVMTVPDFNCAANVCRVTDLILTAPRRYADHIATLYHLTILPLPFDVPELSYSLFWHEYMEKDLAHKWLRELIMSKCVDSMA
jgi:DNA-binding transcriptional LysR family regulator